MLETFGRFVIDDRGNSLAEYSIVAVVFAMIVAVTLNALSREATSQLSTTQTKMTTTASMATPTFPSGQGGP